MYIHVHALRLDDSRSSLGGMKIGDYSLASSASLGYFTVMIYIYMDVANRRFLPLLSSSPLYIAWGRG